MARGAALSGLSPSAGFALDGTSTFASSRNVCPEEPYSAQPVNGMHCQAFFVGNDLVVTAGEPGSGSQAGPLLGPAPRLTRVRTSATISHSTLPTPCGT